MNTRPTMGFAAAVASGFALGAQAQSVPEIDGIWEPTRGAPAGHPPAELIRPGDILTVTGSLSLDKPNVMWLYTVILPNGDVADLFDAIVTGTEVITPAVSR